MDGLDGMDAGDVGDAARLWEWFQAAARRDEPAAAQVLAFSLAEWLHDHVACYADQISRRRLRFPMGRDVAVAKIVMDVCRHHEPEDDLPAQYRAVKSRVVEALTKEFDSRVSMSDVYVKEDDVHDTYNDLDAAGDPMYPTDIQCLDQLVVPVVLGFETPMTVEDTRVVLDHILEDNDSVARKLAGSFTMANTGHPAVRANYPCLLQVASLRPRLEYIATHVPDVLARVLKKGARPGPKGFPEFS